VRARGGSSLRGRGGAGNPVNRGAGGDRPDADQIADTSPSKERVQLNDALKELEAIDTELAELVEMRYFGGYGEIEIAELLEINERTVRRR
jgi:DNA-directed RNA polymerase specialized sigma24 family protein